MARKSTKNLQPLPLPNGVSPNEGFITVPTYLFPQANEYAKEVMPDMKLNNSKNKKGKSK